MRDQRPTPSPSSVSRQIAQHSLTLMPVDARSSVCWQRLREGAMQRAEEATVPKNGKGGTRRRKDGWSKDMVEMAKLYRGINRIKRGWAVGERMGGGRGESAGRGVDERLKEVGGLRREA